MYEIKHFFFVPNFCEKYLHTWIGLLMRTSVHTLFFIEKYLIYTKD
jgi:hypothetical protein